MKTKMMTLVKRIQTKKIVVKEKEKIIKIEAAKSILSDLIIIESDDQLLENLVESLGLLDFLIQKIKNPLIISPKKTALNFFEAKINKLHNKINQANNIKPILPEISPFISQNIKPNNNTISNNNIIPPSPKVVIPAINKDNNNISILEDSIHNPNNINNNIITVKDSSHNNSHFMNNNILRNNNGF